MIRSPQHTTSGRRPFEAVVIGVSSGGMEALAVILPRLPEDFALAVIIVQHLHPHSDDFLARYLDERSRITVQEADEKEPIVPGNAYIAPANYHLLIEHDFTFSLSISEKVNFARPSIDVLFETAAEVYKEALIGVVLTGANTDGSRGLKTIAQYGGRALVQDPATAVADAMPKAALEAVPTAQALTLEDIGNALVDLSQVTRQM